MRNPYTPFWDTIFNGVDEAQQFAAWTTSGSLSLAECGKLSVADTFEFRVFWVCLEAEGGVFDLPLPVEINKTLITKKNLQNLPLSSAHSTYVQIHTFYNWWRPWFGILEHCEITCRLKIKMTVSYK